MGGRSCHAPTRRSGVPYGSGRSNTALMTVKIDTAAPTPITSVRAAVIENAGVRRSDLHAWRIGSTDMAYWGSKDASVYGPVAPAVSPCWRGRIYRWSLGVRPPRLRFIRVRP